MTNSILIWGAGAIGGTIGAALACTGHTVTLVDTAADHVAAINANGLHINGPVETYVARPQARTPETLTGTYRLILLAVKAHHTTAATRMLLGHLVQDGIVVSCQNGLNELVISSIVGRDCTIGAFVNFGADWIAPGEIMFGNRGAVVVGELNGRITPRLSALHNLLLDFEPNAVITDNIWGYLWGKTGYGVILKASALTNDIIADFIAAPANRTLIKSPVREMMRVAAAEGVVPVVRRYTENRYGAKSWFCQRRVAARIEASTQGLDIRFVVTNLANGSAEWLLKIAARISEAATRVRLAFAATCPQATLFCRLALSLQPAGP